MTESVLEIIKNLLNPFDITFLICVTVGGIVGVKKGFSSTLFNLVKNFIVIFLSLNYLYDIVDVIRLKTLLSYEAILCTVFAVSFIVCYVVFSLLFYMLKKVIEIKLLSVADSTFGFLLGSINFTILLTGIMLFFIFFPSKFFIKQIYERSVTGRNITKVVAFLHIGLGNVFPSISHFDGDRFLSEIELMLEGKSVKVQKES
ncbi:MAG: CvpA family protein [Candidatus Aureabacteria bacterium]|nr:CvpA family protein [Candidatus Auribacterota bacterium]